MTAVTLQGMIFYPSINAAGVNGGYIVVGPAQLDGCPGECDHGKIVAGPYLTYAEAEAWIEEHRAYPVRA